MANRRCSVANPIPLRKTHVRARLAGALFCLLLPLSVPAALAGPPNDQFADRIGLTSVEISFPADGADFRAPASLSVSAAPLSPDTRFAAVAFLENGVNVGTVTAAPFALPRANLSPGVYTYAAIATDTAGIVTTSAPVSIVVTPANDDFAHRIALQGAPVTLDIVFAPATSEPGETPSPTNFHRVWYSWTAPHSGVARVWTEGDEVAVATVFRGSSLETLEAGLTDLGGLFVIVEGETYQIGVGSDPSRLRRATLRLEAYRTAVNANFADRLPLLGASLSVRGSNFNYAAFEPDEPRHARFSIGRSVWWTWTAPDSGPVILSVSNADFQPAIAAYTGADLAALTAIASDAYAPIGFYALAGITYQIAVDSFPNFVGRDYGYFDLNLQLTPTPRAVNDDFASRLPLTGTAVVVRGSNLAATREPGEPEHGGLPGQRSLWWTWTAPGSGQLKVDVIADGAELVLGIYTGNTLATLTPQPPGGGNPVGVRVQRGVQYQIALDGPYGQYAEFQLTLTYTPPPPNDDFDHAFVIPEFPATIQGTNGFSSMEPGEPQHHFADYLGGYSIWWTWTAPFTGIVTASVRVPFLQVFDVLGVYTGNSVSTLTTITNRTTDATWTAQEGVTYHIAVDGGYSPFILRLLAPPANDDFAQRAQLTGESNSITAYNLGATREAGEPRLSNTDPGGRSVWWSWTAPADGDVRMFVTGNYLEYGELLPMIGVYTGNTLANLAVVASNLYSSQLRFIVRAGVTYQLQIDGSFGRSGEVQLFLRLLPPAPPLRMDLSNLRRLPGGQVQFPILGRADDIVAIEISSDLRTWHELGQRQLSDSPLLFIDTSVPIQPRRFYRLRNLSSERGY